MSRHAALLALPLFATMLAPATAEVVDRYPTVAVVDYVLGCMRANGQTRQALESCSCSIDVIASILPYSRYERAATFKSMSLMSGEGAGLFKESKPARESSDELKRAQAEADARCF
ncbi:hypothetical protein [Mesorhizobium sp. SP-1A]|uniref:hypothetical protein n=1 Tax=Mesorhizobium sp. SP-1A TaxID=3077840 RepID=UPI0028F72B88|nr:hypothetical protein [Mesorhizobium sp. SP-1A]